MSGNIHFTATGDASDFKKMMRDVRREIQATEEEASDALDEIYERLQQNMGDGDLFGLKEAVADGRAQLEILQNTIDQVAEAISEMPSGADKDAAVEVLDALIERQEQMTAAVNEGEVALKAMRRALIMGSVAVGVAAAAIAAIVIVIRRATKECREMNAALEAGFSAAKNQTGQWIADFTKAQALWKSAQGDVDKLNGILANHRDLLEASGIAINNINDGDKAFIENSDAMVEAIKKRALATAMEQAASFAAQKAAEEYLEAEEKIAKRENRRENSPVVRFFNRLNYEGVEGGEEWDYERMAREDREKAEKSAADHLERAQKFGQRYAETMQEYYDTLEKYGLTTAGNTKTEKEHQQALEDTIDLIQKYADAVAKLREQQQLFERRQMASIQNQIEQAKIDAMQDGFEKERAQREFNQRRELEVIQQSKEEYVRAYRERARAIWEAEEEAIARQDETYIKRKFDPSTVLPDTSAFDALYKTIRDKQENDLINPLLVQYQSFEDKQKEIIERGAADVSALLSKGYKEQARLRREAMKAELGQLKDQYDATFQLIFRDPALMNIVEITNAIQTAQDKIDELSATPESQKANIQYIEALRQAIERLKGASSDFSLPGILKAVLGTQNGNGGNTIAQRIKALGEAWSNMSDDQKWGAVGDWVNNIASGLHKAAEYMKQVADVSGDGRLKEASEQLGAIAQNFAAAGQGAATGGWIGAIVGGASDMLAQTIQAISEAAVLEAQARKNAEDWAMALRNVSVEMNAAAYESPFGERQLAKGREAMRSSVEATRRYAEEMAALNEKYSDQEIEVFTYFSKGINTFLNPLGWLQKGEFNNEWLAYIDAINKGYDGLQKMLVKTKDRNGWANFWGAQDEYTALADLYPELFKDGELVIENAKKLLETNNALDESQKEQIRNLVELKEKYDEAIHAVDDTISSVFDTLGADITEIIWDSVVNGGEDAWARFGRLGSEQITKLGKQLLQEMVISEYLEQFRGQMRAAYGLGDAASTQAALRDIVASIFGGMQTMFDAGTAVAEEYKAWAEANGFDLSENSEAGRRSVAKAMSSVTQESWDVVDGKITNIMMRITDINDAFVSVRDVQLRMLEQVTSIAGHTENLDRMRSDMTAMRSELEDIRTRGIKMQQI